MPCFIKIIILRIFHVRYNQYKAIISINNLAILDGRLPPKVLGLVIEWASIHKVELLENWKLAEELGELKPIAPLE